MPDAGHRRDDESNALRSGAEPLTSGSDELSDVPGWGSEEDDPVAEQLRAWRSELGTGTAGPAPSAERATPTPVPRDDPQETVHEARHSTPKEEWTQNPMTAPWLLNGLGFRKEEPELVEQRPRRAPRMPEGRSAAWDVISAQQPVVKPAEPEISPEEAALSAARTVSFPALDMVPIGEKAGPVEYAIEVDGLRKVFNDMVAVDDVSFKVPKGKIVALLGPNGAGKTTTVSMLCTLLRPTSGTATVNGYDVLKDAAQVRRSIMLTGQFAALDESLTGRENLVLFGRLMGLRKPAARARADDLLEFFSLVAAADKRVGQYSGGMRRRIDIACGLVTEPKVVFLDEPTTGLDPRSRQDVWELVEQLRDSGVTILLTTQYLEEADMLSDNIVVIDKGRVIAEGTSDELKAATGAAYCEVTPAHPAYLPRLRARLADLLGANAKDDGETISVPAPDGPDTLAEVIRRTEAARIPLADIALRRPSLDEVFLALTDPNKDRGA